jgi:maltose O-acetyltransferase
VIRHLVNLFLCCLPPSRWFPFRRLCLRIAGLSLGSGVRYCGRGWIYGCGRVVIGKDTWLSPGVLIYSHAEVPITIGERCDIGPGVEFIMGSHVIGGPARRAGSGTVGAIHVGDGCWIGAGSRILGGVTIGAGSVIAAGAVVIREVPPNTLVAGVPAVKRRSLD